MKNLPSALLIIVAAIALCSCGANHEKQLIGKWSGKATLPESAKNNPGAKMAESMLSNISLEFKEDKKFTMTMMFPINGTWSVSGDTVSCKVETVMGMTMDQLKNMAKGQPGADKMGEMDKPMEFTISGDGKTLTAVKKGALSAGPAGQGDLTFTKSSS